MTDNNYECKKYLVDEDNYSGQIVMVCESYDTENKYMTNPDQVHFLYDDPLWEVRIEREYRIRAYYHYEDEVNRDYNELYDISTFDKDKANQLFKDIYNYLKH